MNSKRFFAALTVLALLGCIRAAHATPPIRAMILDGESGGPYHAWQETTPYLKRMLEESGLFQVDVVTAPPASGDFTTFKPDWGKYQVVVLNYDAPDERWPSDLKPSFADYVKGGGGLVVVHGADNAFPKWREYNLMTGIWRLAWAGREVGSSLVFQRRHAGVRYLAGTRRPARGAAALQGGGPGDGSSHHPRATRSVDARRRRAVRRSPWPGREHDRPGNSLLGPGQPRHRPQ